MVIFYLMKKKLEKDGLNRCKTFIMIEDMPQFIQSTRHKILKAEVESAIELMKSGKWQVRMTYHFNHKFVQHHL